MSKINNIGAAVQTIKSAILQSQLRVAQGGNAEQLSLYFGIGCYVSKNSRKGFWGSGAIDAISDQLQKEMPGLKGFGARNIKNMRQFYEEWSGYFNSAAVAAKIDADQNTVPNKISLQLPELSQEAFIAIGFTHHMEILSGVQDLDARIFYIRQAGLQQWKKETLRPAAKICKNFFRDLPT